MATVVLVVDDDDDDDDSESSSEEDDEGRQSDLGATLAARQKQPLLTSQ